jgi:hypothetical protein
LLTIATRPAGNVCLSRNVGANCPSAVDRCFHVHETSSIEFGAMAVPGRSDGPKGEREKRLAEALKANLKRRKAQQRARAVVPSSTAATKTEDDDIDALSAAALRPSGKPMRESG